MEHANLLRAYGLFDTKVPRYTSFPPANRFQPDVGHQNQAAWLADLPADKPVSIYVHIPFCRRLCWFCACRTQGTQTLGPIDDYLRSVLKEIAAVSSRLPKGIQMARLHLGGGTPTLLTAVQMNRLMAALTAAFPQTEDYEFSVEIDPTEAAPAVMDCLADWGLHRASIGVQDFDWKVQDAIGRHQTFAETARVVDRVREKGTRSVNFDLLYGLPHQTEETLSATLDRVLTLRPDRIALYGYAHVPHMSKRQVMIPADLLPDPEARYHATHFAGERLKAAGYLQLGIDHFALPEDSLARAAAAKTMKRNFQGYTDDPCETLIGFGASSISRFPGGYLQNAVATAAYRERVQAEGLAAHKGYVLSPRDRVTAELIDQIMCQGQIDPDVLHGPAGQAVARALSKTTAHFPQAVSQTVDNFRIQPGFEDLTRVIAASLDEGLRAEDVHSHAI